MDQMSEEQTQKTMEGWKTWMNKVGSALIDMGNPMRNGKALSDNGSPATASPLNGYSLLEAASMDEAMSLIVDHPFLSDKTGDFKVEVFELAPTPEM
jgi:hypothetical protein